MTARFTFSKCKGHLHTLKELLFVGFFFFPELFVQVLIYLRLGQADVRREKEQTSLVCFFLFHLLHI